MSGAPTLDPQAAAEAADAGIATADEHALAEWKEAADGFIHWLANNRSEFTADDVWAMNLGPNPTGSNTALGARFRSAARNGLIENTGRTQKTAQVQSHSQPVTVWRSLLTESPTITCPKCHGTGSIRAGMLGGES